MEAAVAAAVAAATRFVWTSFLSFSLLLRLWRWGLPGSASVPTGDQFNRCVLAEKQRLTMPASICSKVLIAPTIMGMVTRVRITVAMPPGMTLATFTWAITEGLTEGAGIIEA